MKEAREHLARLLAQIKRQDLDAGADDALRPYVDILVNKCHAYGLDYAAAAPGSKSLTLYSQLVELHRCVHTTYTHTHTHTTACSAVEPTAPHAYASPLCSELILTEHNWAITRSLYETVVDEAIAYDDVQNARAAHSGWYTRTLTHHTRSVCCQKHTNIHMQIILTD